MRWVGHVACMGKSEVFTVLGWGSLWERDHLDDPGIDGKTILQRIFKKWDGMGWMDGIGIDGGLL